MSWQLQSSFLEALFGGGRLKKRLVVSLVGAGGKTSLMFQLAREAKGLGMKVLVTTTTRIRIPSPEQYDALDMTGNLFGDQVPGEAGVYVGGVQDGGFGGEGKLKGVDNSLLRRRSEAFDLVLIEADGAACRSLKGWREDEPVVLPFTSHTVGVVDVQSLGQTVCSDLVHRMELFLRLSGGVEGGVVGLRELSRVVLGEDGLFRKAIGNPVVYLNKAESPADLRNALLLREKLSSYPVVAGSILEKKCYG